MKRVIFQQNDDLMDISIETEFNGIYTIVKKYHTVADYSPENATDRINVTIDQLRDMYLATQTDYADQLIKLTEASS